MEANAVNIKPFSLPPLPLQGGALFIDNSTMELLITCPRQYEYHSLLELVLSDSKSALNFGTACHQVLEYRYKTNKNQPPDEKLAEEQVSILTKFFEENPVEEGERRNLNHAIQLFVSEYNRKYQVEPWNVLVADSEIGEFKKGDALVELPFAIPLFTYDAGWDYSIELIKTLDKAGCKYTIYPEEGHNGIIQVRIPIIYSGKIDLPVLWESSIVIVDHKTTSMLGPQYFEEAEMSPQQVGYCFAFEQLTGQKVSGYCINAIKTSDTPAKPTKGWPAHWEGVFQRQRFVLRDGRYEEWKFNLIQLIKEMFWQYAQGYMPMKTKWCVSKYGKCQYFRVCTLAPEERDQMLGTTDFMINKWSPLHKIKEQEKTKEQEKEQIQ